MSRSHEVLRRVWRWILDEVASLLALSGAAAIVVGAALLSVAAAWIVAGVLILALAITLAHLERQPR